MKFIHIADVHLGFSPDDGKSWSEKRKADIFRTFTEIMAVAKQMKIDLVLIAGDLFHRQPLLKELQQINYIFEQISEIKVVIIAGNHDFLSANSNYRNFEFAKNVTFLKSNEIESVYFPQFQTEVYGLSYWHREEQENCYDAVKPKRADAVNVLLAHGGDGKHKPFCPDKILQNGFDYIAAGHIHKGGIIEGHSVNPIPLEGTKKITTKRAVMAGALEPIDSNDTGEHGFWIGEASKEFVEVQFCPIQKCQYIHEKIQISDKMTNQSVQTIVTNLLANRKPYELYKIFLQGTMEENTRIDIEWIRSQEAVVDVVCNLRSGYDYERLKEGSERQILGRFIAAMQGHGESALHQKALEVGVEALLDSKGDR